MYSRKSVWYLKTFQRGSKPGRNAGMTVCAVDDAFSASDEKEKKEKADYFIRSYDEIQAKTYERCGV